VYSVVRANGKQPTQEEIQQQLSQLEHVRELREDIKRNGGLLEALIVRGGSLEVLEGILKRFAEGKVSLDKSYERAVDSGADSAPYKKAAAFRKWLTENDIDSLLINSPQNLRDKMLYEFEKIATRIAALKKKHG
jgi:hypothetical protein